jgi:hypothetical protein
LIPATIIGYTGREDYFEVLSVFRRFITTTMLEINKTRLVRLLSENRIDNNGEIPVLQRMSLNLSKNWEIYSYCRKKHARELIRETSNFKITDYL